AHDVENAIRENTILVSIMHVNNETGRVQPIAEIGNLLHKYPQILFHVDAIQSVGKFELAPVRNRIDLMSISAHNFRGPKGIGFLYRRKGLKLDPLLNGGDQELGLRSGTENVPLIVGLAKAFRIATENVEQQNNHLTNLKSRI